MKTQETTLYLISFAPLIQLWAGICLLFFYCELLDKSPLRTAKSHIYNLYQNIYVELTTKYQVFNSENISICNVKQSQGNKHWDSFRTSIYCMAIFSFFYSLIILFLIGIEKHQVYGIYHQALQVTNTIAIIYCILNTLTYKTFWGQSKLCATCFALGLALYIPFHFVISKYIQIGDSWNQTQISIYTLFTCTFGLILILIHLFFDWYTIHKCKKSINRIKKIFNQWTRLPFSKNTLSGKIKLKWMLIRIMICSFETEWDKSNNIVLETFLKQQIQKELSFLNKKLNPEESYKS